MTVFEKSVHTDASMARRFPWLKSNKKLGPLNPLKIFFFSKLILPNKNLDLDYFDKFERRRDFTEASFPIFNL